QTGVAAGVVGVLVGVADLRDLPAALARRLQAQPPLERIDGERLAALGTGDQIVEVAQAVSRPDTFRQHKAPPAVANAQRTPKPAVRAIMHPWRTPFCSNRRYGRRRERCGAPAHPAPLQARRRAASAGSDPTAAPRTATCERSPRSGTRASAAPRAR